MNDSEDNRDPTLEPPESFKPFMSALTAIATDEKHPRAVTAFRVFALLMGKMAKRRLHEGGFLHSAELTALLTELSGVLGPPTEWGLCGTGWWISSSSCRCRVIDRSPALKTNV